MTNYYRVMLGQSSSLAEECFASGIVGVDFDVLVDLSDSLTDDWREFNRALIPHWMEQHPGKSKIAAGLSCGFLWTVSRGIERGDYVLSPDGNRRYRFGKVTGGYRFAQGANLPHQRDIDWLDLYVERDLLSEPLRNSLGSIGTVSNVTKYSEELEHILAPVLGTQSVPVSRDRIEAASFQMEKHLEDFLITNWSQTNFGTEYVLYEEDGIPAGQQFHTDTGPLDILAISRDRQTLLVIELKRGRASDKVVGQVLRYMSYVKEVVAEPDQSVRGAIVALEDDKGLRRALSMVDAVDFFRYEISFSMTQIET